LIIDVVGASQAHGAIGMSADIAEALSALRTWNYERIYFRPESLAQAKVVSHMLRSLVGHYVAHPADLPLEVAAGRGTEVLRSAVTYVAGMTDRFACAQAARLLQWAPDQMPAGFDLPNS